MIHKYKPQRSVLFQTMSDLECVFVQRFAHRKFSSFSEFRDTLEEFMHEFFVNFVIYSSARARNPQLRYRRVSFIETISLIYRSCIVACVNGRGSQKVPERDVCSKSIATIIGAEALVAHLVRLSSS
jgi:hypothetical protein